MFKSNGWHTQWILRYGETQQSHYHSRAHECMAVLSGTATIRFGAADLTTDLKKSTWEDAHEAGVEVEAKAGDVFLIPAGVAHKTFDTSPKRDFALLTPGQGRGIEVEDGNVEEALKRVTLEGFCMMGAYPEDGKWDFATGGEDAGDYESVWGIGKPERDPVLGLSESGLCAIWKEVDMTGFEEGRKREDKSFDGLRTEFSDLGLAKS
ncbi:hypothetical protein FKW77_002596 [Venturia effusa]|uniref:Cupin type-1 domain-containing protein n=1 Tax=Venturia effusa TaxID=50376 RepID=A0A517KVX8_9PEZI|nr:hypothetical protein FKW77_002596 [Venturia effusa]